MIVVLSDLHFTEAQSTRVGDRHFNRNIPAEVFRGYFHEVNNLALANGIQAIDLVLAGDILEISRSGLWFEGDDRPYVPNQSVETGSSTEATILKILDAIAIEEHVQETLALFCSLPEIFSLPVTLHYIVGNHDRLVNATPAIRRKAREMFALPDSDELFKHHLIFNGLNAQPFCLVRHGHEYDPANFPLRLDLAPEILTEYSEEIYGAVSLGDITTLEFGAALPHLFLEYYGAEDILNSKKKLTLYKRLIDFDDVRPSSALLSFLFSTPGIKKRKTWELLQPCFQQILNGLRHNPHFINEFNKLTTLGPLKKFFLLLLLRSGIFNTGIAYWFVKNLMKMVSRKIKLDSQVGWAAREQLLLAQDSSLRCVVSGHTHVPEAALIAVKHGEECYYLNTGTWRNNIPASSDYREFGHLKSITKVMIFRPSENPAQKKKTGWSFHYLSGESLGNHRYTMAPRQPLESEVKKQED